MSAANLAARASQKGLSGNIEANQGGTTVSLDRPWKITKLLWFFKGGFLLGQPHFKEFKKEVRTVFTKGEHRCLGERKVCGFCGKGGCSECMSLIHFKEERGAVWQDRWFHHWVEGENCLREWLTVRGWLPD